ncbi:MAG: Rpn family recombination-promoting nuclease/putative transposase [Holosporaceae bacterium]|jgi:predicted transposase/invertase (TIGR01784 family)|nr:Rpn family recombination-promoting nuclease/putative transposase [Holosporaceae bacterium]
MTNLLDPKLDYIFKNIFGVEKHKHLLISFLNALLKGNPLIKTLELTNTEIPKIFKDDKASRLDVRATCNDDTEIDIEIQCKNTGEIPERAMYYLANMIPHTVEANESYKASKVIGIWILGKNVTDRKDAIGEAYMTFQATDCDPYQILTETARIIFIELEKFNPKNADARDLLTAWLSFLKDPIFIDESFLKVEEVKGALERLKYISADKEIRAMADLRQRTINDRNSEMIVAREEGREEGIAEGKREATLSMLINGLPVDIISKCTGLSIEDIKNLPK